VTWQDEKNLFPFKEVIFEISSPTGWILLKNIGTIDFLENF
jgi:hypothetical protein